ncbi:hypothetical protein B9Z19DRAFT_1091706 [Tuber borchii]|uniref:Uncharacterized protein n=1 Tax=Tuber borchii TaxID=42251 RepID=A0A2T6ZH88_TUBBO|nr:hypothetical protein B9Z19DRAFT_1091706 [Tuber borchii]
MGNFFHMANRIITSSLGAIIQLLWFKLNFLRASVAAFSISRLLLGSVHAHGGKKPCTVVLSYSGRPKCRGRSGRAGNLAVQYYPR